jgi:DNA-binding MurR/RpiR family transcriptional regulator
VVSRFSQRIGLADYRALRLQLARELGEEGARAAPVSEATAVESRDPVAAAALDSIARDVEAVQRAVASIDKEAVSMAARVMAAASRVVFAGGGDSSGGSARRSARMLVRQGWRARAETDLRDATWTEDIDRGDAVVLISHRGASPELMDALPAILDRGARVVLLTNDPEGPLASAAEVVVRTSLPGATDDVAYVLDPIYPVQVVAARALVAAAVAARLTGGAN